jgi:hypothetical protein
VALIGRVKVFCVLWFMNQRVNSNACFADEGVLMATGEIKWMWDAVMNGGDSPEE